MTVIRPASYETGGATTYVASLALICSLASMTVMMLKFKGFRATFNLNFTGKKENEDLENYPLATDIYSMTAGVYRENREEFFEYGSFPEPPKKITPSMVKLPQSQKSQHQIHTQSVPTEPQTLLPNESSLRPSKSTSDLIAETAPIEVPLKLRKSQPNVSSDPRGASHKDRDSTDFYRKEPLKLTKSQNKEQKLLEKQQRKQLKLAMEEQAKEEKQKKKEKEKKTKEDKPKKEKITKEDKPKKEKKTKENKSKKENKTKKEKPPPLPESAPPTMPISAQRTNPIAVNDDYSNNRDSSISRTTGPPAYTDMPDKLNASPNKSDNTGNTSFGKQLEEPSSWDLVSQHRQESRQMGSRPLGQQSKPRKMVMDLNYSVGSKDVHNSATLD